MGTRGHLGGLAEATLQALLVLDAAGRDLVFLETVGTGQSEIEVIGVADTVVLVLMPGSGDSVQALKAGIMEIPDVIVVNKKDHPAAKTMLNEVRLILALDMESDWKPPIVLTEAVTGEGCRSCGRRSPVTAPTSRRTASWTHGAARTSRARSSRSHPPARRPTWSRRSRTIRSCAACSTRCNARARPPDGGQESWCGCSRSKKTETAPTAADIRDARQRIAGVARETPVYSSETFSRIVGREVWLKAENLQRTGAFKVRGAVNRLAFLSDAEREAGVVAASAGNHGQAVAWAARQAGIQARIFVPQDAPMAKVEACRTYGSS